MVTASVRTRLRATPVDGTFALSSVDPGSRPGIRSGLIEAKTAADRNVLERLQERLRAEARRSFLLVLQGMDTAGKDGTIKHVIGSMDPQGCRVAAFKQPTPVELSHDFLWRIRKQLPRPGEVVVFNRSHYEDVVTVRVHELVPESTWRSRYETINDFEARLVASGTIIVKIFLHISYDEQRRRLLKRLDDPAKHWKFDEQDLVERERWDAYQVAYGDAIARCSTDAAPWYVVPADHKRYRDWAVGRLVVETLTDANPRYPDPLLDVAALKKRLQ